MRKLWGSADIPAGVSYAINYSRTETGPFILACAVLMIEQENETLMSTVLSVRTDR